MGLWRRHGHSGADGTDRCVRDARHGGASGVLLPLVASTCHGLDWVLKGFIVVVVGGMGALAVPSRSYDSLLEAYAWLFVSLPGVIVRSSC